MKLQTEETTFPIEKVRAIVRHAFLESQFYREKFEGFLPESGLIRTLRDFQNLPMLRKHEMKAIPFNPGHYICRSADFRGLKIETTSGSTGIPLECCKSRAERIHAGLQAWKVRRWWDPEILSKRSLAIVPGFPQRMSETEKTLTVSANDISDETFTRVLEECDRFRPEWLWGSASAVHRFALFLSRHPTLIERLKFSLVELQCEYLRPEYVRFIREIFRCGVANQYGATETWVIAYSCPSEALHILDEDFFVEILDGEGRPLPAGEVGRVTITSLGLKALPFIRYDLGDLAAINPLPCECGRTSPQLELKGTRAHQIGVAPDGRQFDGIVFHVILNIVSKKDPIALFIDSFRVVQTAANHLVFHFERGKRFEDFGASFKARFQEEVREKIHPAMDVTFVEGNVYQSGNREKLQYFSSQVFQMARKGEVIDNDNQ